MKHTQAKQLHFINNGIDGQNYQGCIIFMTPEEVLQPITATFLLKQQKGEQ